MNTYEAKENLYDLLKEFDTAMFITCGAEHTMHARPMAVAELTADGNAYFVSGINSPKVAEIKEESHVTLTFQSSMQFATMRGTASVVRDQALVDRLWKEPWKVWFPQGKTDPNITMIKFTAHHGEYWDNAGLQGLKFVFAAAVAYVKGESPDAGEAQHAKVDM